MKLLVDMNLSPRWIAWLAEAGIEAAHWSTLGAKNAPDSEIMAYARRGGQGEGAGVARTRAAHVKRQISEYATFNPRCFENGRKSLSA